jgi:hypothetical protein
MNSPEEQSAFLAAAQAAKDAIASKNPNIDALQSYMLALENNDYSVLVNMLAWNHEWLYAFGLLKLFPDGVWEGNGAVVALKNGKLHRDNGFALIVKNYDGSYCEQWENGKRTSISLVTSQPLF